MTANYPASMGGSEVVFLAGGPPTATDDATTCGAREGNRWHDQVANVWYICSSPAVGAAVWQVLGSGTGGGGITDAPSDGKTYGRLNAAWHQALPIEGGTLIGPTTITSATDANLYVTTTGTSWPGVKFNNASGGAGAAAFFQSQRGGLNRWSVEFGGSEAESGANVGTNFLINRFDDTGNVLSPPPLKIWRSTGSMTIGAGTVYTNAIAASTTDLSKHVMLYNPGYGFSITGGRLNYVANLTHVFVAGTTDIASITINGLTLTTGNLTMVGSNPILLGIGNCSLKYSGLSGASLTNCNVQLASNFGIGFASGVAGVAIPVGLNSIAFRAPTGDINAAGRIVAPGNSTFSQIQNIQFARSGTDQQIQLTATSYTPTLTSATPAAGGTGWAVNDRAYDSVGNTYTILTIDGTTAALTVRMDTSIAQSSGAPANPVALTAAPSPVSAGTGLTVNLTWTAPARLVIQHTAGTMLLSSSGGISTAGPFAFGSSPTAPTPTPGDSSTLMATTAFVTNAIGTAVAASVTSFNTRVGAVTLSAADVTGVGGALLASPAFSGSPTAPTPGTADNSTNIATTGFVKSLGYSTTLGTVTSIVAGTGLSGGTITAAGTIAIASGGVTNALRANMAANTLSGNNTALAAPPIDLTVAQAQALLAVPAASATTPIMDSVAAIGTLTSYARGDHVHPTDTSRFAVAGGAITGAVTLSAAGTALTVTNNTSLGGATTVGSNTATNASALTINGAAGYYRRLMFQTAGVERWRLHTNFTAESGGNAGSDFVIERYDDTGTYIGQSLGITRSTGQIAAFGPLSVSGFFTCTGYNIGGGALPASAGSGTGIGWNLSNGQRETDFLNLGTLATASFNFYQYTAATTTQLLASMTPSTLTLNIGESFGSVLAGSATDLSKHIALFSTTFGFGISSARLNYVTPNTSNHVFVNGTTDILSVGTAAITANVALNHTAGGTITGSTLAGTTTNTGTINLATATATTPGTADNSTNVATTAYVQSAISPAFNDVGSNKLHNSLFRVQQRGAGPWTANGNYTADRWGLFLSLDTASVSVVAATDTDRAQIGDESVDYFLQNVVTGNAGAAASTQIVQRIEFVRRLSNKTVGVSFWAKAASGTPKLGVSIDQLFGTGGSPSTVVLGNGQAVTLSTTWTRFSLTFTIASTAGKTLGTTLGTDYTQVSFWYSSGTTSATRAGNIGVQSGTISLWGVQLEIGPVTPLERPDPRHDLSNCQRFYNTFAAYVPALASPDNIVLPTTMRATPTVAGGGAGFAVTNGSAALITVAQTAAANQTLTLTADL